MKNYLLILKTIFYTIIVCSAILALLFEFNIFLEGSFTEDKMLEFVVTYVLELWAIASIWLSLRALKMNKIRKWLFSNENEINSKFFYLSLCRLLAMGLPLFINVLCYYLFINTTFAGLVAIHFLALMFVIPSKDNFETDTTK